LFRIDRSLVQLASIEANVEAEEKPSEVPPELKEPEGPLPEELLKEAEALLIEAEKKAKRIVGDAEAQVRQMIADAEVQAGEIFERAEARGLAEGGEKANLILEKKLNDDDERLFGALAEIEQEKRRCLNELETQLGTLALDVARKIIEVSIDSDEAAFSSLIKGALRQARVRDEIVIHLSVGDCRRYFPEGVAAFELGGETIRASVVSDSELPDGSLFIDTPDSTIDAGLETQLQAVRLAFESVGGDDIEY
jgi:flagellar biosynthesis/type III secretory pathway protein FliH